jgi:hypothetical protein
MRCRTGTSGHHSGTTLGRTHDGEGYSRVHRVGGSGEVTGRRNLEPRSEEFEAELPRSE